MQTKSFLLVRLVGVVLLFSACENKTESIQGDPLPGNLTQRDHEDIQASVQSSGRILHTLQGYIAPASSSSSSSSVAMIVDDEYFKKSLDEQIQNGSCVLQSTGRRPPEFPTNPSAPIPELEEGELAVDFHINIGGEQCLISWDLKINGVVSKVVKENRDEKGDKVLPDSVIYKVDLKLLQGLQIQDLKTQRVYDFDQFNLNANFKFDGFQFGPRQDNQIKADLALKMRTLSKGELTVERKDRANVSMQEMKLQSGRVQNEMSMNFKSLSARTKLVIESNRDKQVEQYYINGGKVEKATFTQQIQPILDQLKFN